MFVLCFFSLFLSSLFLFPLFFFFYFFHFCCLWICHQNWYSQRDAVAQDTIRPEGQHVLIRSPVPESVSSLILIHFVHLIYRFSSKFIFQSCYHRTSNPIRRNTTRVRGRSYKKEKVNKRNSFVAKENSILRHKFNFVWQIDFHFHIFSFLFFLISYFQHVHATVPNTPNSNSILSNTFRFDQPLRKQHTIFWIKINYLTVISFSFFWNSLSVAGLRQGLMTTNEKKKHTHFNWNWS